MIKTLDKMLEQENLQQAEGKEQKNSSEKIKKSTEKDSLEETVDITETSQVKEEEDQSVFFQSLIAQG